MLCCYALGTNEQNFNDHKFSLFLLIMNTVKTSQIPSDSTFEIKLKICMLSSFKVI